MLISGGRCPGEANGRQQTRRGSITDARQLDQYGDGYIADPRSRHRFDNATAALQSQAASKSVLDEANAEHFWITVLRQKSHILLTEILYQCRRSLGLSFSRQLKLIYMHTVFQKATTF